MSKRLIPLMSALMLVLASCDGPLFGSPDVSASPEACLFQDEDSEAEVYISCEGKWTAQLVHGGWARLLESSGKGDGMVRVKYTFNTGWSSRTDSLLLRSGRKTAYVPLVQQGLESLFSVREIVLNGSEAAEFMAAFPSDWKASTGASWLAVSPAEGVASSNITFKVYPMDECLDSDSRTADINFSLGYGNVSIKVFQGKTEKIVLDSGSRSVGSEGGVVELNVGSNILYSVEVDPSCRGWIEVADTKAFASSTVTLLVAPNSSRDERTGVVTLGAGRNWESLTIIQEGWNAVADSNVYGYYKGTDAVILYDRYTCQTAVVESGSGTAFRITRPSDGKFMVVDGLRPGMEKGMPLRLSIVQNFASIPYRTVKSFKVVKCEDGKAWLSADDGSGLIIPQL